MEVRLDFHLGPKAISSDRFPGHTVAEVAANPHLLGLAA